MIWMQAIANNKKMKSPILLIVEIHTLQIGFLTLLECFLWFHFNIIMLKRKDE